jgi:hypothetical protein
MAIKPPAIIPNRPPGGGAREIRLDDDGRLAESIPCRRCGYDLRGLDPGGRCPECRSAVARSIQGDLLRLCDPKWTARLARGMLWLIIGIIVQIVWGLAGGVIGIVSTGALTAPTGAIPPNLQTAMSVSVPGTALTALIQAVGVWLLTSPDPGAVETARPISARIIARYCFIAQIIAAPIMQLWTTGASLGMNAGAMPAWFSLGYGFAVLVFALAVITLAGYVAGFVYLRQLAVRIPNRSLAGQTQVVMWGFVSAQIVSQLVGLLVLAALPSLMAAGGGAPSGGAMVVMSLAGIGGCFAGFASIVFGIWAIVLLFLYRGALREAAGQARAGWAAEM